MELTTKSTSELLILFCYRYSYNYQHISDYLQISPSTFSSKLKLNNWSSMEIRSINEFIKTIIKN